MLEIIQGSTQGLELGMPPDLDLDEYTIYFSAEQFNKTAIEKHGEPYVTYSGNTIFVSLSQMDTLQLEPGEAKVQINLIMNNGEVRIPTYEAPIKVLRNQIRRVIR